MLIYLIINSITGDFYVGKTVGLIKERFKSHKFRSTYEKYNSHLYSAMRKYGKDNFVIVDFDNDIFSIDDLNQKEIYYINLLNPKYNIHLGGAGGSSFRTFETREKLRIAHTGKRHSEETIQKLKVITKGRIPWNKGLPAWNRGIERDSITKDKIRKKLIGNKHKLETIEIFKFQRKGMLWWNNGIINKRAKTQPRFFIRGRI